MLKILRSKSSICVRKRFHVQSALKSSSLNSVYEKYLGKNSGITEIEDVSPKTKWKMFVPAFTVHAVIGSSYGWSHISSTLMREQGVITSIASDWSLDLVTYPMSILIGGIGFSAALLGNWISRVGPRRAMLQGSVTLGCGYMAASYAICSHSIYLLYPSVGLIAFGTGSLYTPPIQTMIDWFPERKGFASGLVVSGIGSGVLFFAPIMDKLINFYARAPSLVPDVNQIIQQGSEMYIQVGSDLCQVLHLTSAELAKLSYPGMSEGYYLVGTGSTGVGLAYGTIGLIYTCALLASTFSIKRPYVRKVELETDLEEEKSVTSKMAIKTPQFWQLFGTATLLSTGGMGLMSVAKPMITEIFSCHQPDIVTATFATAYLMAMSSGNLFGRFGWAALSDRIGRRLTFNIFCGTGLMVYTSIPFIIQFIIENPESKLVPPLLGFFCLNTVLAVSILGGVYSVLPAYEADLYGRKHVGAIHTRMLPSATVASILGPAILLNSRSSQETQIKRDLIEVTDPEILKSTFSVDNVNQLTEMKSISIQKLLEFAPPGTLDPSPFLYNSTLYTMAGLVCTAAVLHHLVRPVHNKYFNAAKKIKEKEI